LLDTQHEIRLNTPPHFNNANAVGISFSPNGTQLALMSNAAILTVFDISDPAQPRLRLSTSIQGGVDVLFIAEDVLAAGTQSGVAFVHANGTSEPLNVPNSSHWDANITERRLALATTDGLAYVIRSDPARITLKHRLCNSPIVGLFFLPSRQDVAYACRDGIVGIWNLDLNLAKISMRLEDHVDRIAVGADGDNIVAAGTNGRIAIFDLTTGLTARYDGHEYRLTALRAPAASSPHLISADARGAIRVWARSPKFARVIATSAVPFNQAIFNSQTDAIVATSWNPTLTTYSPSTGIGSVGPHERYNIFIEQAIDGQRFATFGPGDNVEIWSQTMSRLATIQTGHGSISQLRFMHETSDLLTAGNDGRLMRWAIAEQRASLIATLHQPIDILFSEGSNLPIIFATSDGVLWHADRDGKVASSGSTGSRITAISSTKKAGSIYVGYSSGLVEIVDTRSWAHRPILNTSAKVRKILPTSRNGSLLVTTDNGNVYFGDSKDDSEIAWTTSMIHVRDIAITPDDLVVAVGSNGAIWATTATNRTWLYAATVRTDFRYLSIDQGGNRGVATETGGDLILIDLNEIRKALAENSHL
jgi:WD40 repeat protein